MRRATLILLFVFFALISSASAQGYRGKDFWICFPQNAIQEQGRILQHSLFLTAESRTTGSVQNMMDSSWTHFSIEAGASISIPLDTALQITSSGQIEKKSFHVISDKDVTIYAATHRPATTDSYSAIPTEFLGKSYTVVGYDPLLSAGEGFTTQADIVATEDNTLVTMKLTAGTTDGLPKGRTLSMALNRGQTLQIKSTREPGQSNDLTGTTVTSSKPIAFFTGHSCAQVPSDMSYCDILLEMETPANDWGKEFILPKFSGKDYYVARVVADSDATDVTINGQIVAHLKSGEYFEAKHLDDDAVIHTSKPALVAQYGTSASADSIKVGDPFMLLAIPSDRFITEVTTTSVTNTGFYHYLNIVVPDTGMESLMIDGALAAVIDPSKFVTRLSKHKVPGSRFTVLEYKVGEGRHLIRCAVPIGVYSYGFGVTDAANYDSYGHACGQRLDK